MFNDMPDTFDPFDPLAYNAFEEVTKGTDT